MATVEFKGVSQVSRRFKELLARLGPRLMGEIGMFLMTRIKTRTAAGVDVNKSAFKPYSASYAFFRQKKGRPIDKVDLFFTGSMMSSMTYTTTADQTRVFFAPSQDRSGQSNPAKAYYLNQKREFFGISEEDRKQIGSLVLDSLREGMRS